MDEVPQKIFRLTALNQDQTPEYTKLYFLAHKMKAYAHFIESSLMTEEIEPEEYNDIRLGAGLILRDMAEQAQQIGYKLETLD